VRGDKANCEPITGLSGVTSIRERVTHSSIFLRLGSVPSSRNFLKFMHPSVRIVAHERYLSGFVDCAERAFARLVEPKAPLPFHCISIAVAS